MKKINVIQNLIQIAESLATVHTHTHTHTSNFIRFGEADSHIAPKDNAIFMFQNKSKDKL